MIEVLKFISYRMVIPISPVVLTVLLVTLIMISLVTNDVTINKMKIKLAEFKRLLKKAVNTPKKPKPDKKKRQDRSGDCT